MGLFNNKPKKLKSKKITLAQAIEYAKNPEYNRLYEFIPVDSENIQAGYIPRLKQEIMQKDYISKSKDRNSQENYEIKSKNQVIQMETEASQLKAKRNQSFIYRIESGGIYKGIDQGISKKMEHKETKYGNYKSAKRYKGDIR